MKGVFDLREQRVKELRTGFISEEFELATDKNVASMMAKCPTATVMNKLQLKINLLAQLSYLK